MQTRSIGVKKVDSAMETLPIRGPCTANKPAVYVKKNVVFLASLHCGDQNRADAKSDRFLPLCVCGYGLNDFIYRHFTADLRIAFCVEIQSELILDNRFASQTPKLRCG